MSIAIIGFVGVIVGAIIAAGSNYLIASRRERADIQRENLNRSIEIKRGSRLIDADLLRAQAAANICVKERHWWSADSPPITLEGWQQYRGIIATELSNDAWLAVSIAVEAVYNLKTARDLSMKLVEQSGVAYLTAMTNELTEGVEGIKTELTAIGKDTTAEEIEGLQSRLTAFKNNTLDRITAMRVGLTEISDSTAKRIVPMLNDIEAGRLALAPFVADVGKPTTSNEA